MFYKAVVLLVTGQMQTIQIPNVALKFLPKTNFFRTSNTCEIHMDEDALLIEWFPDTNGIKKE